MQPCKIYMAALFTINSLQPVYNVCYINLNRFFSSFVSRYYVQDLSGLTLPCSTRTGRANAERNSGSRERGKTLQQEKGSRRHARSIERPVQKYMVCQIYLISDETLTDVISSLFPSLCFTFIFSFLFPHVINTDQDLPLLTFSLYAITIIELNSLSIQLQQKCTAITEFGLVVWNWIVRRHVRIIPQKWF